MRLLVASLTGALFYVSVKSLSIGPVPCTTPEGCSPEAPRCIKCPGAGENTPGYCSFLDPLWQTDLCLNLGYAQFCPNACADRHSISGGPIPAQGIRGPIDTGSPSGTTPETVPQSAPVTVPETAPNTVPNTNPTVPPETSPGNTPNVTPETSPGTSEQSVPVTVPEIPSGTSEQQRIPAGQPGTPGTGQTQPGGSSRQRGQRRPGGRRRPGSGKSGQTSQPAGGSGQTGQPTGGSGQTGQPTGGSDQTGQPTGGSDQTGQPTEGSGQTGQPTGGSGQTTQPEEGSTLEVWPTEKKEETPSTTPSPGASPSGQTLQIPTIPTNSDGPVPDPQFLNNDGQTGAETTPAPGNNRGNPISTPSNLSEEQSRYTPPQLAFASIGNQDGGASQDVSAFLSFDTSTTS